MLVYTAISLHIYAVKLVQQIGFWLLSIIVMSFVYQSLLGGFWASFLLATLLLPGATVMVFGLQRWRRAKRGFLSWLHLFYVLLFAFYLEWLGMTGAYWIIFELQFDKLPKILVNPFFLGLYMFFFALVHDRLFGRKKVVEQASEAPIWFDLTSERKQVKIDLRKLLYIESQNERCLLVMEEEQLPTRERISQLAARLPEGHLRIHRSYIVNPLKAQAISKQEVLIGGQELPVSRSYKEQVEEYLRGVE